MLFEAANSCNCKPWELDRLMRSDVWWVQHALAYRGIRDHYEDWREAQILKAMSKSGANVMPRLRRPK